MSGGLVALLDDIAAIAKLAATSLDDVTAAAGRAGTKAAGVVIDDTAVTPRYVVGLSPDRELPIIAKIAIGSLRNKLLFLLPIALLLSSLAPWAITPLLMIGGAYLCYEGSEKVYEAITGTSHAEEVVEISDPKELEDRQVGGAIRTDFILSAEIMAIALADLPDISLVMRAVALAAVGIAITIGVYGAVGLIVKMDDIGLHLAERRSAAIRAFGRGLVKAMPLLLKTIAVIGTVAMVWVGGGIILHGIEVFGLETFPHWIHHLAEEAGHAMPFAGAVAAWFVGALISAMIGLAIGGLIIAVIHLLPARRHAGQHAE
jgi:predicted DNA repair protein MutK